MRTKLKKEMDNTLTRQNNAFKNELKNELTNDIKNMMSSFFQMNTASSSGSGSLPSNTIANLRGDLKAITTRSGISYDGPPIPPPFSPLPKVVEREPEVTKDTVQPSTKNIQPLVVQIQAPFDEPVALADRGASINLMPLSIWKMLSLPELTLTQMILELADRSTTSPSDITEDVFVKVGKFHFPADFVVVDYVVDTRVPLILRRPFLRTACTLIDVYGEELTLRVDDEAITFKYAQKVLGFSDSSKSGNPTPFLDPILSTCFPSLTPFEGGDFILEEIKACLTNDSIPPGIDDADFDPKGETFFYSRNYRKLNDVTRKDHFPLPFMDQMLERLAGNEYYCFLDGFLGYFQIPIDPQDQEKTTFTCPYGTFAYRRMPFGLCNAPGTFQRCMMAIFHYMIEETMEVFMDDFSVFGDSFSSCLSYFDKMIKRYEDTNLVLNWEKCHFMVKEGIVLGHKISKSEIEVDKAKVDVIAKPPHPTSVKGVRRAENLAADHLSRLKNPHQGDLERKKINETFPLETLGMISFHGDSSTPWFADIANYHAGNFIVKGMPSQQKKKFFKDINQYFWDDPYLFRICAD
ncbi:reverse transcriptase domain-containing protein [Tanacetum coccineum]